MLTSIGDGEVLGETVVPPNIDTLKHVHEEEESDEDGGEASVDEFDKDDGPFDEIERLGHVHHATKDITIVSDEIIDCLCHYPGAHEGRTFSLIGELEIVEAE